MLTEVLLLLLVLVVAALMIVDQSRTRRESAFGQPDGLGYGGEQAFFREPAGSVGTMPAPDPGQSRRRPEGTGSPLGGDPHPGAGPVPNEGARRRRAAATAPADADSADVGDAAGVFDQMRREISRLTASEAALRAKLDAMLVDLSHRGRSLAERQIRLIQDLEHGEQDQRRMASLEKMRSIASRMYRGSENLLILAGEEPSTGSGQPVTLTYLVQAAVSDIEEGERVWFDVQPDIAVRGPAADDTVHLLAELIQNATSFSAANMPVHVTGHKVATGGVLVDITDHGIGMTEKEMAYANWQLENPPATGIDAARWMGLPVVARLAARHGIKVRLNQAESGGLTALVWFPTEVLMYQVPAVNPDNATAVPGGPHAEQGGPHAEQGGPRAEPPATAGLPGSQPPSVAREDAGVIIPPAESPVATRRLPIFDEVESRWSAAQTVHLPSPDGQNCDI